MSNWRGRKGEGCQKKGFIREEGGGTLRVQGATEGERVAFAFITIIL